MGIGHTSDTIRALTHILYDRISLLQVLRHLDDGWKYLHTDTIFTAGREYQWWLNIQERQEGTICILIKGQPWAYWLDVSLTKRMAVTYQTDIVTSRDIFMLHMLVLFNLFQQEQQPAQIHSVCFGKYFEWLGQYIYSYMSQFHQVQAIFKRM